MGYAITQSSTAQPLLFLMIDASDHISPKTGLTVTVTLSKNGGSFASPSGAVTEVGSGLYKVAGNATDSNTLGPLWLHATATGADPTDDTFHVVSYNPQDATALGLSRIDAAVTSRATPAQILTTPANLLNTNASGYVTVVTNNDKTGYALSSGGVQAVWDALTSALTTGGSVGKRIADNLDVTISSRLSTTTAALIPADSAFAVWEEDRATHTTPSTMGGGVNVTVNNDKTGYSLSTAGVLAIWHQATSAIVTAATIGKQIKDNLDAAISSRMATFTYTAPPSAATIAGATWDEARAGHVTAGTYGQGVASVQGNVTGSTASVSGAVGSVTGNVGGNVVGSVASVTAGVTVATNLDKTGYTASTVSDKTGYALTSAEHVLNAADAQTGLTAQGYTSTRAGYLDTLNGLVTAIWAALTSGLSTVGSVGKLLVDNINATISSRMATFTYTAPPTAAANAAATWDEARSGHTTSGTFGQGVASVQGNVTGSTASVSGAVGSVTAGVTVTTNNDKTGYTASTVTDKTNYSLSSVDHITVAADVTAALNLQGYTSTRAGYLDVLNGLVQAIWDKATSALTVVGSIGKYITDMVTGGGATPATLWAYSDRSLTDKAGFALSGAQHTEIAEDVQAALTSQGYTPTRAGFLDTISTVPAGVWNYLSAAASTAGSLGKRIVDNLNGTISGIPGAVWGNTPRTLTSAGAGGATAEEVWGYDTRTLTTPAVSPAVIPEEGTLTALRGDTFSATITGLGNISQRTKLWFTVKAITSAPDSLSLVQIEETDGLLILDRIAATDAADGSILVTNETTGSLILTLQAAATALLPPGTAYRYDIQTLSDTSGVETQAVGVFVVEADVTRAVE